MPVRRGVAPACERMDPMRVDQIMQYALAAAGQGEWDERELGPIHLVKYVYLADLAYASRHGGVTYTGAAWRFHHFGPWDPAVHSRIAPAMIAVEAQKKVIRGAKYGDFERYLLSDVRLLDRLQSELPGEVASAVRWAVRDFGCDTATLLRHVYLTRPMIHARPGEPLCFAPCADAAAKASDALLPDVAAATAPVPLTWKQRKTQQAAAKAFREDITGRLQQRVAQRKAQATPPEAPLDEVYARGVAWLDSLAGPAPSGLEAEAIFSEDIWTSPARTDPDVP